jgi:hypothetical protein
MGCGSRAWLALMRRNVTYRRRYWLSTVRRSIERDHFLSACLLLQLTRQSALLPFGTS